VRRRKGKEIENRDYYFKVLIYDGVYLTWIHAQFVFLKDEQYGNGVYPQ
jgi:hypothetical protein